MVMRGVMVVVVLGLTACGPRLSIRREQPARADLGADVRALTVVNGHRESVMGVILDPLTALARTSLTPDAVRTVERDLSRSGARYRVLPRCGRNCPAADALVEVSVTSVSVERGDTAQEREKVAHATVQIRVIKANGQLLWEGRYSGERRGGVPNTTRERDTNRILSDSVDEAVAAFVRDLYPQWIHETFRLEDDGPLEPCARAAMKGNLDAAEGVARQVLAQQPNHAGAIYNLGVIFTAKGQLEAALEAFQAAARLHSKYQPAADDAAQRISDRSTLQQRSRQ